MTVVWNPLEGIPHHLTEVYTTNVTHRVEPPPSEAETRNNAIREAVTWLVINCRDWEPEELSREMARALLSPLVSDSTQGET